MSLRRDLARRSISDWAIRLALAAVTTVVGYYSLTFSIAQVIAKTNPAFAYRLAPYDARITGAYAISLSGEEASPEDRANADRLAKAALRRDATAVTAAATLGLNADIRGNKAAARRYFTYAQKLSRRDVRTQLWMIEDAVERSDVPGALLQYDITLRVSPALSSLLYPVLISAMKDPVIRRELVHTLGRKPPWGENFINFAATQGSDPQSMADLLTRLRRSGITVSEAANAGVVNALVAAGRADAAWTFYASVRPGVDRRRSRDRGFAATIQPPSLLDWMPLDAGGVATGIQDGVFDFSAPASVGGAMLQQFQLLPPGVYRLTGHSVGIDAVDSARPYWSLKCMNGREIGRIEVPNSTVANGIFRGVFSVPAECPVQVLVLTARSSDAVAGLTGQFDRVELAPAR
ncbi:hypothetical protein ASE75_14820 [Sphingomonas sp. Leaf17]|uniref:hypothetical protein n=1 Tax=Sphingomonas sp. Leaf17 TaxID=1735683 RepID=UPI0006F2B5D0|nr:hypothetical protein [Sphingomonas sp. Leaf17]KQM62008.1 hypothetical protein ASE75_14820 [Sphingomonas sp. Leaf17]